VFSNHPHDIATFKVIDTGASWEYNGWEHGAFAWFLDVLSQKFTSLLNARLCSFSLLKNGKRKSVRPIQRQASSHGMYYLPSLGILGGITPQGDSLLSRLVLWVCEEHFSFCCARASLSSIQNYKDLKMNIILNLLSNPWWQTYFRRYKIIHLWIR